MFNHHHWSFLINLYNLAPLNWLSVHDPRTGVWNIWRCCKHNPVGAIIADTRKRKGLNDIEVREVSRGMFFFFGPVWICCKTLSYFFIICGVFCFPQGKKWELALPCVMFLMPLIGVSLGHWDIDADTIFGSRVRGPSNVSFGCRSMMREFCGCYAGHCKLMTQM